MIFLRQQQVVPTRTPCFLSANFTAYSRFNETRYITRPDNYEPGQVASSAYTVHLLIKRSLPACNWTIKRSSLRGNDGKKDLKNIEIIVNEKDLRHYQYKIAYISAPRRKRASWICILVESPRLPNDCIPTKVLGGSREPSRINSSTQDADERRGKWRAFEGSKIKAG